MDSHDIARIRATFTPELLAEGAMRPPRATKATMGRVYFVQESVDGPIKVGWARDPEQRLRELQVGNHRKLNLLGSQPGTMETEWALHEAYSSARLGGEWFLPLRVFEILARGEKDIAWALEFAKTHSD